MNKVIKQKWVKALLSGKYGQATGFLERDGGYCCLGVLVVACDGKTDLQYAFPLQTDLDQFGIHHQEAAELAFLNDASVPFEMIAGLIQEAL